MSVYKCNGLFHKSGEGKHFQTRVPNSLRHERRRSQEVVVLIKLNLCLLISFPARRVLIDKKNERPQSAKNAFATFQHRAQALGRILFPSRPL